MRWFELATWLALSLAVCGVAASPPETPDEESMLYRVSYRGIFSAMAWMDVADAVLRGRERLDGSAPVKELELYVSSEQHGLVESVYPFRYRVRSLFQPQASGSLAFESYRQTKKRRHDLFWLDRDQGRVVRFRPDGRNPDQAQLPAELAQLIDPEGQMRCEGLGASLGDAPLFDRLSLLHRIRTLDLRQVEHLIPVTDGKRRLSYRVTREGDELVEAMGRSWPSWRLKVVQAAVVDEPGVDAEPAASSAEGRQHRPVYIWVSKDAARLPLLLESQHAIGRFQVRLAETDYRLHADAAGLARRPGHRNGAEFVAQGPSGQGDGARPP